MRINEIYLSVEGEGKEQGNPTIFIRTYGCNQRCSYCDSLYAIEGDNYRSLQPIQVLNEVNKFLPYYYICLTGGEALIQEDIREIVILLLSKRKTIWIETNGTQDIRWFTEKGHRCKIIMDIKCPSSGNKDNTYWKNVKYLRDIDQVKFVINTEADYDYAKGIAQTLSFLSPTQILFSPVLYPVKPEIKPDELVKRILDDKLFVRYSLQIHKYIWKPDKRGV